MRISKKIFGLAIVAAALFTSCNKDVEGAIYNNQDNAGVSFTASTLSTVEVPASNPVFDVEIIRGNTAQAATGTVNAVLKSGTTTISGVTVSNFNFAAGENKTTVQVNISPLEVGVAGTLTLTLADADASIGAITATTIKCSKAYEWISLGKGTYTDNWLGVEANVEMWKADGFDRYRVAAPYAAYLASPVAVDDWGADWLAPATTVNPLEIWIENGLVFYDDFPLGINYEADKTQPIYGCHPTGWESLSPDFNKVIDAKTIQLAPYYYINGLGGWNNTQKNGVILITLP